MFYVMFRGMAWRLLLKSNLLIQGTYATVPALECTLAGLCIHEQHILSVEALGVTRNWGALFLMNRFDTYVSRILGTGVRWT
jgi:hypothetical protein